MSTVCLGCRKSFTQSGFGNHLAQTKKPACKAFAATFDRPLGPQPDLGEIDFNQQPIPYEGDYFGPHIDLEHDENEQEPEPPVPAPSAPSTPPSEQASDNVPPTTASAAIRDNAETGSHPHRSARPMSNTFLLEWELARWAMLRGPGSTAFSELLAIPGLVERLDLSYKTTQELEKIVDMQLSSGRPRFVRQEIELDGETFEVYFRDVVECIKALFSDPELAPFLLLVPERHYADADRTVRVYFEMNTGKWWWVTQVQVWCPYGWAIQADFKDGFVPIQTELEKLRPGATVVPILISSDKTQLTLIGNKTAYPVYMTLGNLPKSIRSKPSRRGQILLAYLPTTRLEHMKSTAGRRRGLANLFHACLTHVLKPLVALGVTGFDLVSGDGIIRRGHPILATYIGDYPEQLLVTGIKSGECPKCTVPRNAELQFGGCNSYAY
ncbi:hypothetical protein ONZ51_g4471 [Trametes cubensis]|uniref:Uncharacterized protein n=1 Tax=Trametes cubensis TaxID=1111947 RepID=A0AAD7TY69_9APHY|nr:hypothetical protein ONZ51_g4471 [Trametes cubensis]